MKSVQVHNAALKVDDMLDALKRQIQPWMEGVIDDGTEPQAVEYLSFAKGYLMEVIEMLNKAANTQE